MSINARVAITGLGLCCPIGCEPSTVLKALRQGRSGIGSLTRYSAAGLQSLSAGQVPGLPPGSEATAQLSLTAARQAWHSAAFPPSFYSPARIGLCVGASGAGLQHDSPSSVFDLRFQPQQQASVIASDLNIAGPVVMFTNASVGSALALVHAMSLLRSGRCDLVVAGGAECLSRVNHESMDSMRLCSLTRCSPFSGEPGITVGEGSAFFVLESLPVARTRGAHVLAELFSFGVTHDAYDMVTGNPSGEGLARAMRIALTAAGIPASAVDWIKANGTANREQDSAETLAVKQVFAYPPPLSALESFVGHANGAAPAIGLALALIAFDNGLLPPTLNFSSARPGCDLDYVPNESRPFSASRVLANSLGFGGSNVALLFGAPLKTRLAAPPKSSLCITGVGVVSPFGAGLQPFISGLCSGASAIRRVFDWPPEETSFAALVEQIRAQRLAAKSTLLQQYASSAAQEAFSSAALDPRDYDPASLGVFAGLCRGSAAARSRYAAALADPQARMAISKLVLHMARFTVASSLSLRFQLQGYGATISEGFGAGLHALAHACIYLENASAEQAVLVVAADETGPGPAASLGEMKWLAAGHDGCYLRPYDRNSRGTILGEGAVALIVERTSFAERRGAPIRARIEGVGLTSGDSASDLAAAMRQAAGDIAVSAVYGNGCGIWPHDEAELQAWDEVLSPSVPRGCVNSGLGFAESASGLFHVAAALHGLSNNRFFSRDAQPVQPCAGLFPHQLLTARTEGHRNAAVLLGL